MMQHEPLLGAHPVVQVNAPHFASLQYRLCRFRNKCIPLARLYTSFV
jgi:hypothetical protein